MERTLAINSIDPSWSYEGKGMSFLSITLRNGRVDREVHPFVAVCEMFFLKIKRVKYIKKKMVPFYI